MKRIRSQRPAIIGLTILLAAFCLKATASAQQPKKKCQVSGVVVDSLTREGEMYATMKITTRENPLKAVKMAVTDKDGAFKEWLQTPGNYTLTINAMGRRPIVRQFAVKPDMTAVTLDTLYISDASKQLEGVEIVAQKPLVKADIDKIEYNMEDDPDSKTNSILEMLRKVPLVTVDGEENIKVNGSSNFKVYVNGRPNNMMSNNPKDVLKSMPASSIRKIEVITNPGPKYDAEGVGGILNIVTVGKGLEGYTATFNGWAAKFSYGGSVYSTIKKDKLTMSARYNYNYSPLPESHNDGDRIFTGDPSTPSASNATSRATSKTYENFHSGNFEASYDIDTLRLVTASIGISNSHNSTHSTNVQNATSPLDGSQLYAYKQMGRSKENTFFLNGSFDYQRLFHVKERMLTFSYRISTSPYSINDTDDYKDREAADDWTDFISLARNQFTDVHSRSTEHTFQIDYTTPIGKAHTIETGVKYILRDNRANSDRYLQKTDATDYLFDDDNSMHYRHRNDILAAYTGYGLKLGKFSGRAGLRYEHTKQDVKYVLGNGQDFGKDFNDLVPSASIGYRINDQQSLRFAYNMRIWRPNIWYLNPYLDQSTPGVLQQGNSNLVSEKNHSFALTYNFFAAKFSTSWTLRHSFTNNSIESVTTLVNDNDISGVKNPTGKMVNYGTYYNIGKTQTTSLSGYISWTIFKNTRLYMNTWVDYSDYNDRQSLHNYGWYGSLYMNLEQTLPKDWQISAGFSGWTSNPELQSKSQGNNYYSLSLRKSMLNKRLTISLFANNFLQKERRYKNTRYGSNFTYNSEFYQSAPNFGINLSLRLGELTSGVKKAMKSIENDDVKSGNGK